MTRALYKYCEVQQKVVPIDQVMVRVPANVAHGYIPDEMAPTKHPTTGQYYTSKAKLRQSYKDLGLIEIGTAYENGYDEQDERKYSATNLKNRIMEQVRERLNK